MFLESLESIKGSLKLTLSAHATKKIPLPIGVASMVLALPGVTPKVDNAVNIFICGVYDDDRLSSVIKFIDDVDPIEFRDCSIQSAYNCIQNSMALFPILTESPECANVLYGYTKEYISKLFFAIDSQNFKEMESEVTKFVLIIGALIELTNSVQTALSIIKYEE